MWNNIDETSPNDTDYIWSPNNLVSVYETSLGAIIYPNTNNGWSITYRIAKTNDGTLDGSGNAVTVTMELYQGTT